MAFSFGPFWSPAARGATVWPNPALQDKSTDIKRMPVKKLVTFIIFVLLVQTTIKAITGHHC
jgi:hypothetical protein